MLYSITITITPCSFQLQLQFHFYVNDPFYNGILGESILGCFPVLARALFSHPSELDHTTVSKNTKVVYFLIFFCFRHEFTQIIKFNNLC